MRTRPLMIATLLSLLLPGIAAAQRAAQTQTLQGTVKEIQDKGRISNLIVTTEDGKEHEFPLTPKIEFSVTAPGDQGFVRAGQFFSARGLLTNDRLFLSEVQIYLMDKGQRPPAGKVAKVPVQLGESENLWEISGTIVARQSSPDYPEYEMLAIRTAGRTPPLLLEKDFTVTVFARNPDLAKPEMPVELEGTPRGERFNLVKATVKLTEPLNSAEVFGDSVEKVEKP